MPAYLHVSPINRLATNLGPPSPLPVHPSLPSRLSELLPYGTLIPSTLLTLLTRLNSPVKPHTTCCPPRHLILPSLSLCLHLPCGCGEKRKKIFSLQQLKPDRSTTLPSTLTYLLPSYPYPYPSHSLKPTSRLLYFPVIPTIQREQTLCGYINSTLHFFLCPALWSLGRGLISVSRLSFCSLHPSTAVRTNTTIVHQPVLH